MRSMARCVLPVLVGPSTAVTPAPRAPASRLNAGEKEIAIKSGCERWLTLPVSYPSLWSDCCRSRLSTNDGLRCATMPHHAVGAVASVHVAGQKGLNADQGAEECSIGPLQNSICLHAGLAGLRNRNELGCLQDARSKRRRQRRPEGHHHPRAGDRG